MAATRGSSVAADRRQLAAVVGVLLLGCKAESEPTPAPRAELSGWIARLSSDRSGAEAALEAEPDAWRAYLSGALSAPALDAASPALRSRARRERGAMLEGLGKMVAEVQLAYLDARDQLEASNEGGARARALSEAVLEGRLTPTSTVGAPPVAGRVAEQRGELYDPNWWLGRAKALAPSAPEPDADGWAAQLGTRPASAEPLASTEAVAAEARRHVDEASRAPAELARPLAALGYPEGAGDRVLVDAARARLERREPGDCADALALLERAIDHRQPDRVGPRNRPGTFVELARAASCAGRHTAALGAIRALDTSTQETAPVAELLQRMAAAAVMLRGRSGDLDTER